MARSDPSVIASAGKGAGDFKGGQGRGMFSKKQTNSPFPVPRKASQDMMSSPLQGKDASKVESMKKRQSVNEDLRGMAG